MRWRFSAKTRFGRTLEITLVIFSLVHTPLPEPDFHNIRHHDADGGVCEHHDHLLRWHPGAGFATDVAVLHWHWFLPSTPGTAALPVDSGMAMHAHVPAWQPGLWESGPRLLPDSLSRLAMRPVEGPLEGTLAVPGPTLTGRSLSPGAHPPLAFSATFAPGVSLASLLNRWLC